MSEVEHQEVFRGGMLRERRSIRLAEGTLASIQFLPEVDTSFDSERTYLRSQIIGQDAAIDAITEALDKSGVRHPDDKRPVASFVFLGPTGVGKTETARALSKALNQKNPHLLKIDCSNFSNGHEITTLLGAPPSYVGSELKPLLSKENVEHDGCVVLFDEIEKGSHQLNNILLSIMDTGVIRLNNGEEVSFRGSVVILTSNLGANEISKETNGQKMGFAAESAEVSGERIKEVAQKSMRDFFSPELLNRLDSTILFSPLNEESLHAILESKLSAMNELYRERYGAFISLSTQTRNHLVEVALTEKHYGVRPLVRAFEKQILAPFGRHSESERVLPGSELMVYHRNEFDKTVVAGYKNELIFSIRNDTEARQRASAEAQIATGDAYTTINAYSPFQPPPDLS